MAKKKKGKRRKFSVPLAVVGGLAVGSAEPVQFLIDGKPMDALYKFAENYTGLTRDGRFAAGSFMKGAGSLIMGVLVHKFVGGSLGVNRALGQAGVPILRL